ncbi:MATE family efflux transporter [Niabella hibiscisoli]|uniref:oligosaccharide flippase family protein n=1 Tax=Niabella hibiscisoli TaxID=1825928 RepID=UPI001F0F9942|nr:oligosaccharide flippase family protein [Niabella hibiscisoli]MCH5719957.1 oligosaccharide flippase family protein [Niabella hibiscisoli]
MMSAFFQGANSITNQYLGLVFTAMAADYFPKLSAVVNDVPTRNSFINSQFEIVILIVAPIASCMIALAPFVVQLLLSKTFIAVVPIVIAMAFGVLLKAASYPLGYISFAKGDKRLFFWLEGVLGNGLQLLINILFYNLFGLQGLGYSFILIYTLYFIIITIVAKKRYGFVFQNTSIMIFLEF